MRVCSGEVDGCDPTWANRAPAAQVGLQLALHEAVEEQRDQHGDQRADPKKAIGSFAEAARTPVDVSPSGAGFACSARVPDRVPRGILPQFKTWVLGCLSTTIPESLIDQIRTGKAALVVRWGIGSFLEATAGAPHEGARDTWSRRRYVATRTSKVLHKGSLVRAVGFLAAHSAGDLRQIVGGDWAAPPRSAASKGASVTAVPPHRTTFPGDVLEHALETQSPARAHRTRRDVPELGELSPRRRTLARCSQLRHLCRHTELGGVHCRAPSSQ